MQTTGLELLKVYQEIDTNASILEMNLATVDFSRRTKSIVTSVLFNSD